MRGTSQEYFSTEWVTAWKAGRCRWGVSPGDACLSPTGLPILIRCSSFVGNSSRVKLLFCLIFLAHLHIQGIFCLLPLFAIPFCQGIVLFFASGLRTNLSSYYYFMFYTCLNSMCPLVSVFKLHIFLQKSLFSYTRNPVSLLRLPTEEHN